MKVNVFPAELAHLYGMLRFIEDYALSCGMPSALLGQVVLAAEEALVNVVSYGYPEGRQGEVEIACEEVFGPHGMKITIRDEGVPFNPIEHLPSDPPSASPITRRFDGGVGGYGIYILVGLMDRVEYHRSRRGNSLTLTKYFCGKDFQ